MAFNKKRLCCCDGEGSIVDIAYFEVKSVVPITTAEQVIDKTYSYWFERGNTTFVGGNVPDSTVLWERGSSTNINSELTADLTYGAWKAAGSNTAYVGPSGGSATVGANGTVVPGGGPSPPIAGSPPYPAMEKALMRRGWYLDSTTRVLTESQWEALDECKVRVNLPTAVSTGSGGINAIEIYSDRGWMFGNDQYNASPAIGPITKGDLTWEVYPKVNCNYPIKGDVHDFSALFPTTFSMNLSGNVSIAYKFAGSLLLNFTSADCSGSYTFTKTETSFGISYVQTSPDPGTAFIGEIEVGPFDDFQGGTYNRTLKVLQPTYEIKIDNFGAQVANQFQGSNLFTTGTSANCTNVIGYNLDANRVACDECDPNDNQRNFSSFCSPANFDGSILKDHNYVSFGGNAASPRQPNTINVDLDLATNYPTQEAFDARLGGSMHGVWALPQLIWGAATGSTVSLEIKAPTGAGLNSFIVSPPTLTCCNPNEGTSPIQYYMAGGNYVGFGNGVDEIDLGGAEAGLFIQTT